MFFRYYILLLPEKVNILYGNGISGSIEGDSNKGRARHPFMKTTLLVLLSAVLLAALPSPAYPITLHKKVFDITPERPIGEISALNSGSKFLAVELVPGSLQPARVVEIDMEGNISVVEDLTSVKELDVPAGRLWIAEGTAPPAFQAQPSPAAEPPGAPASLPVTGSRVYLSGDGESYTVVYLTKGRYYELRHKDRSGKLLFLAIPRDDYGFKTAVASRDGNRILVLDESPQVSGYAGHTGQRYYFYSGAGKLLSDTDLKDEVDDWLDISGGFMAQDGSYFAAARGMGKRPASKLVLLGEDGSVKWEKEFFETHTIVEDDGGLFRVKGGSLSLIHFVDAQGELRVLERKGYGFEFWVSASRRFAYVLVVKPFDTLTSGVEEEIGEIFPLARVVSVDMQAISPPFFSNPRAVISPDGMTYIHSSQGKGGRTSFICFDYLGNELMRTALAGLDWTALFVDGGRAFILREGYPAKRLMLYERR